MMINVISNLANGAGLQRDAEIIRDLLEERGHEVRLVQFDNIGTIAEAQLTIMLEVLVPDVLKFSPVNWWFVNPEWTPEEWLKFADKIDLILCKTRDAYDELVRRLPGSRVEYVGFESRDMLDSACPRERKFLHVAGKSLMRNTTAVLAAWKQVNFAQPVPPPPGRWKVVNGPEYEFPELIVLSQNHRGDYPNVRFISRVSSEEYVKLLNSCTFNLMPSAYEGFGQALWEANSAGAVVITTDGPSTKDAGDQQLLVESFPTPGRGLVPLCNTTAGAVVDAVRRALKLGDVETALLSSEARDKFVEMRNFFRAKFDKLLTEVAERCATS